jgi:hypothetical protein
MYICKTWRPKEDHRITYINTTWPRMIWSDKTSKPVNHHLAKTNMENIAKLLAHLWFCKIEFTLPCHAITLPLCEWIFLNIVHMDAYDVMWLRSTSTRPQLLVHCSREWVRSKKLKLCKRRGRRVTKLNININIVLDGKSFPYPQLSLTISKLSPEP